MQPVREVEKREHQPKGQGAGERPSALLNQSGPIKAEWSKAFVDSSVGRCFVDCARKNLQWARKRLGRLASKPSCWRVN